MKKDTCERCGKELGVFARTYQINKPRLNIQYDCLCSSCYKTLSQGIDLIEKMRADMLTTLKNNYRVTKLGSVDIDTLIGKKRIRTLPGIWRALCIDCFLLAFQPIWQMRN